eukprot:tig00000147_g9497.t1
MADGAAGPGGLEALPDALLDGIVSQLGLASAWPLRLVCHRLKAVVEAQEWPGVELRAPLHADGIRAVDAAARLVAGGALRLRRGSEARVAFLPVAGRPPLAVASAERQRDLAALNAACALLAAAAPRLAAASVGFPHSAAAVSLAELLRYPIAALDGAGLLQRLALRCELLLGRPPPHPDLGSLAGLPNLTSLALPPCAPLHAAAAAALAGRRRPAPPAGEQALLLERHTAVLGPALAALAPLRLFQPQSPGSFAHVLPEGLAALARLPLLEEIDGGALAPASVCGRHELASLGACRTLRVLRLHIRNEYPTIGRDQLWGLAEALRGGLPALSALHLVVGGGDPASSAIDGTALAEVLAAAAGVIQSLSLFSAGPLGVPEAEAIAACGPQLRSVELAHGRPWQPGFAPYERLEGLAARLRGGPEPLRVDIEWGDHGPFANDSDGEAEARRGLAAALPGARLGRRPRSGPGAPLGGWLAPE